MLPWFYVPRPIWPLATEIATVVTLVTHGMLSCEPFIEWGLFPVDEVERFLCELANQENGVLSTPLQDLIECCPVTGFQGILKNHFSRDLCAILPFTHL